MGCVCAAAAKAGRPTASTVPRTRQSNTASERTRRVYGERLCDRVIIGAVSLTNLLRFDYWLDASVTAQPAGPLMWALTVLAVLATAGVLFAQRRMPLLRVWPYALACLVVALVGLGRVFQIPVLGWRVGWLVAALVALTPALSMLVKSARADALPRDALAALSFQVWNPDAAWRPTTTVLWWLAHVLGMAIVVVNIATPRWPDQLGLALLLSPLPLVLAIAPTLIGRPGRALGAASLVFAPFVYAYAVGLLSAAGVQFPGRLNGLLDPLLALIISTGFALAIALRVAARSDLRLLALGEALLITFSALWAGMAAGNLRTHGVSGSDPYAYTQMGVDLARTGTLAHHFPLVALTYELGIDSHPVTHVGYRLPTDDTRLSTTVWPPGYAWFTAAAWTVGGETGVFWLTPLFNALALLVIVLLALQMSRQYWGTGSGVIAAITVFLTVTSYQQVEWQMIPMADLASQVFSLLALWLAWRAQGRWRWAVAAGVALGMAFNVRYTQVLIAPALVFVLWPTGPRAPALTDAVRQPGVLLRALTPGLVCGLAALLTVMPTFAYHNAWFGSPFQTGSEELQHFSISLLPATTLRALGDWHWYREYGLITPLIGLGAVACWLRARRLAVALVLFVLPVFGLHMLYSYFRLRDLLSIFPIISLFAAIGVVTAWTWVTRGHVDAFGRGLSLSTGPVGKPSVPRALLSIALIYAVSFVFVLRSMETLAMPINRGFSAFGYLVPGQRESFNALARVTEPNAAIGGTLNSGAIDLHAGRQSFRPGVWPPADAVKFIEALLARGTPVYLLVDGDELKTVEPALQSRFTLTEIIRVNVPYYQAVGGGSANRLTPLYRLTPK
jgi:Dolichyl-phosphate-mannose-protein mannosyltransferase